jgi:putative ABC transport system ATP-binding protein
MEMITRFNRDKGITVVMVTHEPDMAEYARRVIHFRDGLVASDNTQAGAA